MKDLMKSLWRAFILACLPFALLLAAGWLIHRGSYLSQLPPKAIRPVGILLFLLSVVLNIVLPILIRVRFHGKALEHPPLTVDVYLNYQHRLSLAVGIGGAVAGAAYLAVVPNLFLYGSVLCGLYGIYSILPAEKKNSGELRAYGCNLSAAGKL